MKRLLILIVLILCVCQSIRGFAGNPPAETPATATKERPFVNTLGMKFVPVPGTKVLFCIHDTTNGNYRQFAKDNLGGDKSWMDAGKIGDVPVSSGEDHPVVCVSWMDAVGFCGWLSVKESRTYRLPTDHEWSVAVGIGDQEDSAATPASKSGKIKDVYPWGRRWPPPAGAGNFADSEYQKKAPKEPAIEGYTDGYATTSPVMTFPPNSLGLYDMSGNVWQFCQDLMNPEHRTRVKRGGGWNVAARERLWSSFRGEERQDERVHWATGFRCVLVP
ncbi:MAG TPA: SUMF1/EgtB/PvdO family nonheme iron enzyme [Chthoniobacter sp.]|jgi:formylglycine-generating enzyme required for sulfatase activity